MIDEKQTSQEAKINTEKPKERDWREMSIIEISIENQSVHDYIHHWEGRCLKAESEVLKLRKWISDLDAALPHLTTGEEKK